ncbi:pyruvate dehydrogenase E2 component (dihydrolipoamide acetyltransferase) [Nitrosomonas cryotolerans]|uniref:Acetyltransferase component of pyruvate dehydrogenase complex n=1 Tax=Nitrosomonas cryotolerans ATCC 49181 TaxID=1131553 RepID=A0A1N6IP78_9PROT|nr:dihydrolipoyllysine-residue acetyltransferase [Nitrosomonas cryotolerans]SFP35558.1 pyruvate dehydrogenase E2 component (dihydrolipoamide acetyltransferase) [Nitrosomonas cryotolerans]SIO33765.1 pyruvate dehydrogenase E2 component (dihydrolipoamide acetyltransferase) [Nitrosomonas cryotolerans ATCC 49181]
MAEVKQILIPDIGDFKDVPVIELLVKVGDKIVTEDPLISLESDKATIEIPAPLSGIVKEIYVKPGDKVSESTPVLSLEILDTENTNTKESAPVDSTDISTASIESELKEVIPQPAQKRETRQPSQFNNRDLLTNDTALHKAHAGPAVRRFARELGVNLALITGSGPKQRILKEDIQAYVKTSLLESQNNIDTGTALNLLPWPRVDFAKFGPIEQKPLTRIKQISGANLHRNWVMIPHVTQFDEADITDLEILRKRSNEAIEKNKVKLTLLAFLMKGLITTLKIFPEFNASLSSEGEETNLIIKHYYHLGFAVDTPNGLVVPVIKDIDQKGVVAIAEELSKLSELAREGKLKPTEMQGASFTISSLGGIGGTAFTPIINAPEVAILGVSRASLKPVYRDNQFIPRLILPLSLSYDHRVIDGASAARFTAHLTEMLADMRLALL